MSGKTIFEWFSKVIGGCILISLLVIYNNNYVHTEQQGQTEKEVKGSRSSHFRFPIPEWSSNFTCAFRDNRSVCKSCRVKVHMLCLLLLSFLILKYLEILLNKDLE